MRTHLKVSPVPFTHVHSIHKSAFHKQDHTLFTGSHVHTSFSCVSLIHRRAKILQVKHHLYWFTSHSSIASSNVHISFTLADPVHTVPLIHTCIPISQMQSLFTSSHPFPTHTRHSPVQICTSRYTTKDIGSIIFECVRSVRKVS